MVTRNLKSPLTLKNKNKKKRKNQMPAGIFRAPFYDISCQSLNFKYPERWYKCWFHRSGRLATLFPPRPNRTVGAMHTAKYKMWRGSGISDSGQIVPCGYYMTKSAVPLNTALPCVIQIQTQCVTSQQLSPPTPHTSCTAAQKELFQICALIFMFINLRLRNVFIII